MPPHSCPAPQNQVKFTLEFICESRFSWKSELWENFTQTSIISPSELFQTTKAWTAWEVNDIKPSIANINNGRISNSSQAFWQVVFRWCRSQRPFPCGRWQLHVSLKISLKLRGVIVTRTTSLSRANTLLLLPTPLADTRERDSARLK